MRPGEPPDALTIRTKAGLTQSGLAKLVRTSTSVISRLEVATRFRVWLLNARFA